MSIEGLKEYAEAVKVAPGAKGDVSGFAALLLKAANNPDSKAAAVKAKCAQCEHVADEPAGNDRIRACRVFICGLHHVRPYASAEQRAAGLPQALAALPAKTEAFDPVRNAKEAPESKRAAVNAFCWQCVGCGAGSRREIHECGATWCPLHHIRPYQTLGGGTDGEEAPETPS